MRTIEINNTNYTFSNVSTIEALLKEYASQSFTLQEWNILIKKLYGKTFPKNLIKVLDYKIKQNDKSSDVNSFIYKDKFYWFDKNTRLGLMNLANCSSDIIEVVLGEEIVEMSTEKLKNFLSQLEVYAGKCFINTQKHLNAIKQLKTVDELIDYDYTTGYPDKITLDV